MQIQASKSQNLSFSYTTSSGKSLSLNMFDKQSINASKDEHSTSLNLRREYGFSFTYQGSKLTQDDVAEIKNAMKDIEPLISDFLSKSKVGELEPKEFITNAMQIANILPSPKDENMANATMSSLVDKFNSLIKNNQSTIAQENTNMLEDSKKLIEEILKKMKEALKLEERMSQNKDENGINFLA